MPPSPSSLDHRLLGHGLAYSGCKRGLAHPAECVWREGFLEEAAQVIGAHWAKQGSQAEGAKCLSTETGAGWGDGRRGHMRVQGRRLGRLVRVHVCVQKPLGGHQRASPTHTGTQRAATHLCFPGIQRRRERTDRPYSER